MHAMPARNSDGKDALRCDVLRMPLKSTVNRDVHTRHYGLLVFLVLLAMLLGAELMAQVSKPAANTPAAPATVPVTPTATPPAMTAADMEAFFDGMVPVTLERENIAGVVVLVVKDGKVLFTKGYGYADVAKKKPVSPEGTMFRPGSTSKLFTWTAVMQLVEQGKLDLDRDVNDYLDFRIPPMNSQPVTLRNIMTHTAGFEEVVQNLIVKDQKALTPLGDYLKKHQPERVYVAGTTPAYSNYGATLAGYIVQRVSGQQFDSYVEEHIFLPLGMTHSTFRQPLPEALKPLMSNGYTLASQPAKPYEFVEPAPAGSVAATATDMARFMIAHLQDGQFEGVQILRPETARLMHALQFQSNPAMSGMALGFYEETRNGHRIIGHAGDLQCFHTDLHLIPDAGVGFFISQNSAGKGTIRTAVWDKFLDRYFPYELPSAAAVATARQDAQLVSGRYMSSRRAETTLIRVIGVASQLKVFANPDGTISADSLKNLAGEPIKFREIAPLIFRDVNGQDRIAFERDNSGRLLMSIDFPFMVFQKSRWFENSALQLPMIIGALAIFVLTLLLWPVAAIIRRHYGKVLDLPPAQRRLRLVVHLVCVVDLVFLLGFLVFFSVGMRKLEMLGPRFDALMRAIQIVGWLGVVGTVAAVYNVVRTWTVPDRWLWSKLADTVIGLACLAFVWFVFTWNMLHWSLRY